MVGCTWVHSKISLFNISAQTSLKNRKFQAALIVLFQWAATNVQFPYVFIAPNWLMIIEIFSQTAYQV